MVTNFYCQPLFRLKSNKGVALLWSVCPQIRWWGICLSNR